MRTSLDNLHNAFMGMIEVYLSYEGKNYKIKRSKRKKEDIYNAFLNGQWRALNSQARKSKFDLIISKLDDIKPKTFATNN